MNDKKILIPFILITAVTFILNMTTQMTLPTFSVYLKHLEFPVGLIGAASLGPDPKTPASRDVGW